MHSLVFTVKVLCVFDSAFWISSMFMLTTAKLESPENGNLNKK